MNYENEQDVVEDNVNNPTSQSTTCACAPKRLCSNITVEPVLFLFNSCTIFSATLAKEYLFYRISEEHGLLNATGSGGCYGNSTNSSNSELAKLVNSETSKWSLYSTVPGLFVAAFTAGILGTWTDAVGRKAGLLISNGGLCLAYAMTCFIVYYHLPLYTIIIANLLFNICGGYTLTLACCFAYLTDTTPRHKLTFMIAVAEIAAAVGSSVTLVAGGFVTQLDGFLIPYVSVFAISVITQVYIMLRMEPGSVNAASIVNLLTLKPARQLFKLCKNLLQENMLWRICLYIACLFLFCVALFGMMEVITIYLIGAPFCLDAIALGMTNAVNTFGGILMLPFLACFKSTKSEYILLVVGLCLFMLGAAFIAIANKLYVVFIGLALSELCKIGFPVIRTQTSGLVSPSTQGALFAVIAIVESISLTTSSLAYNGLYTITAKTNFPGSIFTLSIAITLVIIPLFSFAFWKSKVVLDRGYARLREDLNENGSANS